MSKFDTILKKIEEALPQMPVANTQKPAITPQQQQQMKQELLKTISSLSPEDRQEILAALTQQNQQQKPNTPGQTQQPAV